MLNRPYNFFFFSSSINQFCTQNSHLFTGWNESRALMKTFGCRSISSKLESSAKEITRCVDRISLGQSMMPLQTNSWRIPRESSSSSLFVPSISFPPVSPLSTPFFATRYPLLCIISFLYSAIGLYSRTQSFIIFRWKKGGQKYTEYPRARRHPVDYFENIIAKRGEEKRGRRNGEEMEKGQASVEKARFSTSS